MIQGFLRLWGNDQPGQAIVAVNLEMARLEPLRRIRKRKDCNSIKLDVHHKATMAFSISLLFHPAATGTMALEGTSSLVMTLRNRPHFPMNQAINWVTGTQTEPLRPV